MSNNLQNWIEHKSNPASKSLYTHDATVIYVPTSAGARGPEQISHYFSHDDFNQRNTHIKEKMHNRVMNGEKLIEEADWTITLHSGECLWLAPTVPKETLLGSTVTIPVIRSVVFDEDKILSIRVYWDQASVLQQLKVIASRKGIPVRGVEQVEALRNLSTVKLNVWNENSAFATAQSPDKSSDQKSRSHLCRIFGSGEAETESAPAPVRRAGPKFRNIFAAGEPEPTPASVRRAGPEARNIFTYQPKEEKRNVPHNPKRYESNIKFEQAPEAGTTLNDTKQNSSSSLPGQEDATDPLPSVRSSAPAPRNIFQYQSGEAKDDASDPTPSVRSNAPPPRNIFQYQPEEKKSISHNPHKFASSFSFAAPESETVASPTSSSTGIQTQVEALSLDTASQETPAEVSTTANGAQTESVAAASASAEQESPVEEKPKSTFVPKPMFGQSAANTMEESFSGRSRTARANQSSFSLTGNQSPEQEIEQSFSGRRRGNLSNQSSFSFAEQEAAEHKPARTTNRRDPNASSFSLFGAQAPLEESVSFSGKKQFKQPEHREPEIEKPRVKLVKKPGNSDRNIFG
ncbi:hypothetical protein INT43_005961 [Umbelopsis isabellina]|uniref:Uncharacterized protein n=1 Tax=Mortierella isabellina TaxID=91625 RepID=A0A8H7PIW3_MORIS|nr:hypothetical protein INT43_005961 [Umbelopsis isabellina]